MQHNKKLWKTAGAGVEAEAELVSGSVYDGVVTHRDSGNGVYQVTLVDGRVLPECVNGADAVCGMLGIQSRRQIPQGTPVKVVYDSTPCILGTLPGNVADTTGARGRTMTGEEVDAYPEGSPDLQEGAHPIEDMLEGEMDMTNNLRVGLQLLTTFARLQAGSRAVVETCLLNDMVRVVSEVFRHHSATGDQEIYNDGRLNSVEHATSYEHETWGLDDPAGERLQVEDGKVDLGAVEERARYRYSRFLGFLGDFLHVMVYDPLKMVDEELKGPSGKARVQMMADGTLLAQSVSEICMEKVVRVQVPVKLRDWDDPEGNLAHQMNQLENRYLRLWQGWDEDDPQSFSDTCYQLREYARWLNTYHSFARFLQLDKDYRVDSEEDTEAPDWNSGEDDRENANSEAPTSYDSYACIRIMRDGSIVLWSGDGSSLVMTGGSIDLHAALDLNLYAARDVRVRAGNDLHLMARRHVNLAAIVGGIRSKSRTYWEALCERGSLWLKSDAPAEAGEHTGDDPEPVVREHAVLIESTEGKTGVSGAKGAGVYSSSNETDDEKPFEGVAIHSGRAGVSLETLGSVDVTGERVGIRCAAGFWVRASNFLCNITGAFSIKDKLTLHRGTLFTQRVQTRGLDVLGPALVRRREEAEPVEGLSRTSQEPENWEKGDDSYVHLEGGVVDDMDDWEAAGPPDGELFTDGRPVFEYPAGEYTDRGVPRETLTDQYLRLDNPEPAEYGTFTPQETSLQSGIGTSATQVVPVSENNSMRHSGGQNLREPSSTDPKDLSVTPTSFTEANTSWKYKKPQA